MEYYYEQYESLLEDPNEEVRKTLACGIHEIIKSFGIITAFQLGFDKIVIKLMNDSAPWVQAGLLTNFHHIVDCLVSVPIEDKLNDKWVDKNFLKMEDKIK